MGFLEFSINRFRECKVQAEKTFDQLEEPDFFFKPNEESNSISVIIRHLHGNMVSRWSNFLTEDGEKSFRNRDGEFEEVPATREGLMELWEKGWTVFLNTLESLTEEDLKKTITIRSQSLEVTDAILRQLAHYSGHIGQIIYLGRWIKNKDWKTLSIPRHGSEQFNQLMKKA
jgi:hypothetical protein